MAYALDISFVNETENYRFSDHTETTDLETPGEIYRQCQKEFGRCTSKVYIDGEDGVAIPIGWYFQKKSHYSDTNEPYLVGAWVMYRQEENE